MEYKKIGQTIYLRMDRDDEIIASILTVCRREGIASAVFTGIGGCRDVRVQVFHPEEGAFRTDLIQGELGLISLTGNVISDEKGELYPHTHALFTLREGEKQSIVAGHVEAITVHYTAEIELRPVIGGTIGRKYDPETGTGFWSFGD